MAVLPAHLGSGIIEGQLMLGRPDDLDSDKEPNLVPAKGHIVFTPRITHIPDGMDDVVVALGPIKAELDAQGFLCVRKGTTLERGVALFATDTMPTVSWTWMVSYCLDPLDGINYHIEDHSIHVMDGVTMNLADLAPVPSSEGIGTSQWEMMILRAEAAAEASRTAAEEAVSRSEPFAIRAEAAYEGALLSQADARDAAGAAAQSSLTAQQARDEALAAKQLAEEAAENASNVTSIAYNSKTVTDLPSTYMSGISVGLMTSAKGWPNVPGGGNGLVEVRNERGSGYNTATQTVMAYTNSEAIRSRPTGMLYRWGSDTHGWSDFVQILTSADMPSLNVKQLGAKGDGVTDDTTVLTTIINTMGTGRTIVFPKGVYKVTNLNPLTSSNCELVFEPGAKIISDKTLDVMRFQGTISAEKPIMANTTYGSEGLTVGSGHGLNVGDWIYIKSQRDSLGDAADDDWRLGYATPAAQGCFYAEFHQVREVFIENVSLSTPIIFPDYRTDNTMEGTAASRPTSTWQKVDFVQNVTVKGLTIESAGMIRTQWAKNVVVEDYTWRCTARDGYALMWMDSLDCEARNAKAYYDTTRLESNELALRNAFKVAGSHKSGFRNCLVENGTQCFDFTYFGGGAPTVACYAIECETIQAQSNSLTTHGGSYMTQVVNNRFHSRRSGPSIRSRNSVVTGNIIEVGDRNSNDTHGIYLYEGWARDCIISNNIIRGAYYGIRVRDAVDKGECFTYVGATIMGNTITDCVRGIQTTRGSASTYDGHRAIVIQGNIIRLRPEAVGERCGIRLGTAYKGVQILNNTVSVSGTNRENTWGVFLEFACYLTMVYDNNLMDLRVGIEAKAATGSTDGRLFAHGNQFGSTNFKYALDSGIEIMEAGFYGALDNRKMNHPGIASGPDAAVLNALVTGLVNRGFIASNN